MKFWRNIMNKLIIVENCILGRWSINHSKVVIDRKVYLANIDHSK